MAWVLDLRTQLQIPNSLRDLDIDESSAVALGAKAEANPTGHTNPITLNAKDYEAIFHSALEGNAALK